MNKAVPLLTVLLVFAGIQPALAAAQRSEAQNYRRAFATLDAGHADKAYSLAIRNHDAILNKVLLSYYMAAPGNAIAFSGLAEFIRANPAWPNLRDIRAIAEQKLPLSLAPQEIIGWFQTSPPVTVAGFMRYIDALAALGRQAEAAELIRRRWIEGDFREDELTAFYARYGGTLGKTDHLARLDRLLWSLDAQGAHRMFGLVDADERAVAEARLALGSQKSYALRAASAVAPSKREDAGLLYERLRYFRRANLDNEAIDILEREPLTSRRPQAWWEERQIMVRRMMDKRDFARAYQLASEHGEIDGKSLLQSEFLSGWLALRFLNKPEVAKTHFERLFENARTPISRARGAYWLGRAFEALDDKAEAEQAYEAAGALDIAYYGQLAMTRIYAQPVIKALPEPSIPVNIRNAFFARDNIRAIERLHGLGDNQRAHLFFKAAVEAADRRAEFALLSELAYQIQRPDYAIEAAKAANQKNMLVAAGGFPVLDRRIPSPPEPAFTYALIRQESMFNPEAASPVGAHGLMQLMPVTAKAIAKSLKMRFQQHRLDDPDFNLRLGTTFVQHQIDAFNGSYLLALAGYNAGPSRVREWMTRIGDPRSAEVDPVDWIELIPAEETRNYVQRILENLQIYRARLNGGRAQLLILKDLKR